MGCREIEEQVPFPNAFYPANQCPNSRLELVARAVTFLGTRTSLVIGRQAGWTVDEMAQDLGHGGRGSSLCPTSSRCWAYFASFVFIAWVPCQAC